MQVTLVTRLADVAMLLAMAALPPQGSMIGMLIALHLMRMATANCTRCVLILTPYYPLHGVPLPTIDTA